MATILASHPTSNPVRTRSALIASGDRSFRERLNSILSGLRWQVREAQGGAQAWVEATESLPQTLIVDSWLPDLDVNEFVRDFQSSFPNVDVIPTDEAPIRWGSAGPNRQEILYALRRVQEPDTAAWNAAPDLGEARGLCSTTTSTADSKAPLLRELARQTEEAAEAGTERSCGAAELSSGPGTACTSGRIPELIGNSPSILEVSRRIHLVAPRNTSVLIEGPTGTGKEVVARALHRLSARAHKPLVAINCAAIPEGLMEAELFGHARGAFTGAVQRRIGRIEACDGGTLFLDEIGEMPLELQAKLLRFVETGELQRIGDNACIKVDIRIIAATHRPLAKLTQLGRFRSDLYYRLAVFLIRTPSLREHREDLSLLVDHFMERTGRERQGKSIEPEAIQKLRAHDWPGNVRELEHVLERAAILAGDAPVITARELDFGMPADMGAEPS